MGGLFSIYEGIHKVNSHEGLKSPMIAVVVLSVSMILEAASLYGCITQINKVKHNMTLWTWVKSSRQSELIVVLGEDIAALLGLFFALIAIVLSIITGNPVFDAFGSIAIGVLLIAISFFLALKNPPFGGKERAEVTYNFPIKSGETAFLFLQHFIKILKAGGRGDEKTIPTMHFRSICMRGWWRNFDFIVN